MIFKDIGNSQKSKKKKNLQNRKTYINGRAHYNALFHGIDNKSRWNIIGLFSLLELNVPGLFPIDTTAADLHAKSDNKALYLSLIQHR